MAVLDKLEVLVIDDQAIFLDLIEEILRTIGVASIARARSGEEAFALLNKAGCTINCVLCDVSMAQDNGFGLLMSIHL